PGFLFSPVQFSLRPLVPTRSRSCRLDRPQDGLQQVVVVARASLERECFDLGGRNPGLAQSPLHALDDGERIFILAYQGDADARIFALHVGLPLGARGDAARARAPSRVGAPAFGQSTRKTTPKRYETTVRIG